MTKTAYLVTMAGGPDTWVRIPPGYFNDSIEIIWSAINGGRPLQGNNQRPINRYALNEPDWGVEVIFNKDHVQAVAAFPVWR